MLALQSLSKHAEQIAEWSEKFEDVSWESFLKVKSVNYMGDEVRVAHSFQWENVKSALPSEIGHIRLEDVCSGGILDYVQRFESYLLPEDARVYTKPPRVMVEDAHWMGVCKGLVQSGVCEILPLDEVFCVNSRPILNGLFGVSKNEFDGPWEVYRVIMNLIPLNKLCRNLVGDVCTLPTWGGMHPYLLEDGEVALLSSEDIRCFFYLFKTPPEWRKYMAFNREVPPEVVPPALKGKKCVLTAAVLPMGFLNSVTIAQHIHRKIASDALLSPPINWGPEREIRRDKPFSQAKELYRVYLDNFDMLCKVQQPLAERVAGTVAKEVQAVRTEYHRLGLPIHPKKAVMQQTVGETQGAIFDGVKGKAFPKPEKIRKYVALTLCLLREGRASLKQVQIVCGGLVYLSLFRRPLLGALNSVWRLMGELKALPPVIKLPLPSCVKLELVRFLCLVPLAHMDFRSPYLGEVTASDASQTGGGFCSTKGLTPAGVHAASCFVRGDLPEPSDRIQLLTVALFDNIGALRVATDCLKLPVAGHISAEISEPASRVLESQFPDVVQVGSVESITRDMVTRWACRFCNVGVVLVGGGLPSQGVTPGRKGALKDARTNLSLHVRRIYELCREAFPWAQCHFLMESVASLDNSGLRLMSEGVGVQPWLVDAFGVALCHRPRLYWCSWEICPEPGCDVEPPKTQEWTDTGHIRFKASLEQQDFLSPGWTVVDPCAGLPTFTIARPTTRPGNRPAGLRTCRPHEVSRWEEDEHRFPPYQYKDCHLLQKDGEMRLPSVREREVILGFPAGYTAPCMPKQQQKGAEYTDLRLSLLGNTWCVQVVALLLSQLTKPLGLGSPMTLQEVVDSRTPGKATSLQGFLNRLPVRQLRKGGSPHTQGQLIKQLAGLVSTKGEDLLLQADTENTVKYHRLRASVPARLWRWKEIAGWSWKFSQHHINILEMKAVHTCLQWRLCRKKQIGYRFLHLTDSLVCLHALSRGRTSSRKLRRTLVRINALLLASNAHPLWGYVHTSQNPADRPSRRLKTRKPWAKKF